MWTFPGYVKEVHKKGVDTTWHYWHSCDVSREKLFRFKEIPDETRGPHEKSPWTTHKERRAAYPSDARADRQGDI